MNEKRLASSGDSFVGLTEMQIGDLLNKLSDENTRLHKKVDEQQDQFSKLQANVEYLIDSKKELIEKIGEQQATIKKQDIEIQSLNLHIKKLVDGDEISQLLMREYERSDELEKENEKLKERLYDFEKRKIIEESEIDEDVIPKVKLLRTELFGEKYE